MKTSCIIVLITFVLLCYYYPVVEPFQQKSNTSSQREKSIQPTRLHPIGPNIIPLRKHVTMWIVNVPLTPFIAPILFLPPLEEGDVLPPFLLYKSEYIAPVRNQGDCGSCFAFAVCDMLSDRIMISSGGLVRQNLSVQQILNCYARDGCDGGSPEDVCFWLGDTQKKLVSSKVMPYRQSKGGDVSASCPRQITSKHSVGVAYDEVYSLVEYIDEYGYDKHVLNNNIENMKMELYIGGPFYCAISVYDDLFTYNGLQPYRKSKNASLIGGHAVTIIGYCEKGQDPRKGYHDTAYWICRNSWGKDWPLQVKDSGHFTIVMGENMCGIESRCGFAEPQLFGQTPKGNPLPIEELRYTSFHTN